MTVFQLKRSNTANKRPDPALLLSGELALNYDLATGGVYYTNDAGQLTKIGPAQLSDTAPNSSPAGSTGNSLGEFWYDTINGILKVWDGTDWVSVSGALPVPAFYETGGRLLEAIGATATAASVLLNFPTSQISNLDTLTYSNGVFTNTTAYARTFTFDLTVNLSNVGTTNQPFSIWFQKNSTSAFDATAVYGLNTYQWITGSTPSTTVSDHTTWTFTLQPGDSVTCWSSFGAASVQFGGDSEGVSAGNGTRVNVTEIVAPQTGYQSGGYAEYTNTPSTIAANTNAKLLWNSQNVSSDFSLTYNNTTASFTNNTNVTRTYTFDVTYAGFAATAFEQWAAWFTKNNPTGDPGGTNRYGGTVMLGMQSTSANNWQINRTLSYTFTLDPSESVQIWEYATAAFNNNSAFTTTAGNFTAGQASKLRITEIQAALSPQWGGQFEARGPATVYFGGNTLINSWTSVDINDIQTLSQSNGLFTNTSNQARTYKISSVVTLNSSFQNEAFYVWLQWNSTTASATNRLAYFITRTTSSTTNHQHSLTETITLEPGGSFSVWFYTPSNSIIGGAAFGCTSGYSNRLSIQDITAVQAGYGSITGVTAGVGLSGGGTEGNVTIDLVPPTSSEIGGVKQGAGVSIASDGTLSAALAQIVGGTGLSASTSAGTVTLNLDPPTAGEIGGVKAGTNITIASDGTISSVSAIPLPTIIPNDTAPTTGLENGYFWLNTSSGPFTFEQRVNGAWVTNDTTSAITNSILNTVAVASPYPTLYDITGIGGASGYNPIEGINNIIFSSNYNVTSTYNKVTNILTFSFTSVSGPADFGTILTSLSDGVAYQFVTYDGDLYTFVIRSHRSDSASQVTFTAACVDREAIGGLITALSAAPGAVATDYQISNLGKNIFNGSISFNPSIRGILAPSDPVTGSFLYWSSPFNDGSFYQPADLKTVGIADMIQAGSGINVTYDALAGEYQISNTVQPLGVFNPYLLSEVSAPITGNSFTIQGPAPLLAAGTLFYFVADPEGVLFQVASNVYNAPFTTITVTEDFATAGYTPVVGDIIGLNGSREVDYIRAGSNVTMTLSGQNTLTIDSTSTPPTAPAGANTQIQYNNNGAFGAEAAFSYDAATNRLTVNSITANSDVASLLLVGSAATADGATSGGVTLRGGDGGTFTGAVGGSSSLLGGPAGPGGVGGAVFLTGGAPNTTGTGGDVNLKGGTGAGAGNRAGNVTISPGNALSSASSGTVSISGISVASTVASYTPSAATDLTTKAYVDSVVDSGVAGANTQIQFNNNGAFGADADLTYDSTTNTLTVPVLDGATVDCGTY